MNALGLIAGLSAFAGIWFGHVCVRKIEYTCQKLWPPVWVAILLGLICEYLSLQIESQWLSVVFGILGMTLFWDALEFKRQEARVKKGHAPANPSNPRHIKFLLEYPSATVQDLLDRNPIGHPVTPDEASRLIQERGR